MSQQTQKKKRTLDKMEKDIESAMKFALEALKDDEEMSFDADFRKHFLESITERCACL